MKVLERAGLISRGRDAQRRPCRVEMTPLLEATDWLEKYRNTLESSFQRLDALLEVMKAKEKKPQKDEIPRRKLMRNTGTLQVTTPSDREIVLTRVFNAPRHMVFEAFSKPELLKQWFGPHGWSLSVCEVDFRVGGSFRFVMKGPSGRRNGHARRVLEIAPPERSVHMESFDDFPGESQVTTVFVEKDGKTTMTATVLYDSKEVRDAVIQTGMEHGAAETYDRLAEFLLTTAA